MSRRWDGAGKGYALFDSEDGKTIYEVDIGMVGPSRDCGATGGGRSRGGIRPETNL